MRNIVWILLLIATTTFAEEKLPANLPKGHRILIQRGLQLQGMVTKDDVFHLKTYESAGYTSINWIFESDLSKQDGFPWARWAADRSRMPPIDDESKVMNNLVMVCMSDEK